MAFCNNCGKEYLTKVCIKCRNKEFSKTISKNNKIDNTKYNTKRKIIDTKEKNNKKVNIPMIVIATAVSIIALIMVRNEYVKHQEEKQIAKLLYGTDDYDEIEKINKKLIKQTEKSMKQLRNLYIPK